MKTRLCIVVALISSIMFCCNTKGSDDSNNEKAFESNRVSSHENEVHNVLGEENYLYKNPSQQSQKVINQKASSTFNTTMYCQIDRSTKVKILESTNGWFKVQVVEPNWLRNSHIGWVKESVIKVNEIKGSNFIEWRSPKTREFAPIGRVLVSNNIEGCGEYKVFQESSNQYLIACTRDGKNWNYYKVRLNSNTVKNLKDSSINPPY